MISDEGQMRAAVIMRDAARTMQDAASTIDRVWSEMRVHVAPGYGNALCGFSEQVDRLEAIRAFENQKAAKENRT